VSDNTLLLARLWRLSQDNASAAPSPQASASKASAQGDKK
jgi:hypothetical protein